MIMLQLQSVSVTGSVALTGLPAQLVEPVQAAAKERHESCAHAV
jgi:hypothetical protein